MPQEPVSITGVHLRAFRDRVWVELEIDGKWLTVITDHFTRPDYVVGHIVEPAGIRTAMEKHQSDKTG